MKIGLNNFLFERNNSLGYCVVKVIIYRPEYIFRNWSVKSVSVKAFANKLGLSCKIYLDNKNIWETLENSENQQHK